MAVLIDPVEPVEVELLGVKWKIRVLTSRQWARVLKRMAKVQEGMKQKEDGDFELNGLEALDDLEAIVRIGVAGWEDQTFSCPLPDEAIDMISVEAWGPLYGAILETNVVTEDDAKNSPSPQQ